MRLKPNYYYFLFVCLFFIGLGNAVNAQLKPNFTIVIDAGHGGKDSGTRGVVEDEKHIALDVALKFGRMIEKNHPDVKVIYTRKTDVFLELWERANIANKNHANLFVSIHCNAAHNKSAFGSETFVMGLRRMSENVEVSQRENNVILLEDDQERYQKFDPTDEEAIIAFEIVHSAYLDQSIRFAQFVEDEFVKSGRSSRGVKQAIFHVLRQNASPAVLVELGFISNKDEGAYLATESGKEERAQSIYKAFQKFKAEYDSKNDPTVEVEEKPKEIEKPVEGSIFRIEFLSSKSILPKSSHLLNGVTDYLIIKEGDYYKYYYGNTDLVSERDKSIENLKRKGFKTVKTVEFQKNEALEGRLNYRIQFLASNNKYRERDGKFNGLKDVLRLREGDIFRYYFGEVKTLEEAEVILNQAQRKGFTSAFIVIFDRSKPKK